MANVELVSLAGRGATEGLLADWQELLRLPDKALHNLWEILLPSLERPPDAAMEQRAEGFCRLYDVAPPRLQAALRACRHLLTSAASLNLNAEQLAQDLAALCGDQQGGDQQTAAAIILSGYETARQKVRRNIVQQSLLDHGRVLVGLDWRVDQVQASDRGNDLSQPVALITLRMHKNGREQATTFYAVPDVVTQIKQACTQIEAQLGKAAPSDSAPGANSQDNAGQA